MDFVPKLQPITENIEHLTYNKKLLIIKNEAQSLYSFCLSKGFTELELKNCVTNLHGPRPSTPKKVLLDSSRSLFYIAVSIALTAVIILSPTPYKFVCANLKIASIKFILPYWNFSDLYDVDCMLTNPYLPEDKIDYDKEYCDFCIKVKKLGKNKIDRLEKTNSEEIEVHYIDNRQPVVVTDTTKDWGDKKELTVDEIMKLYMQHPLMSQNLGSCNFSNNVGLNETIYDFHNAFIEQSLPEKWHAIWLNCDPQSAKVLRRYYTRPYFLPNMVQASSYNKVILAKGFQNEWEDMLKSEENYSGEWVTVVQGALQIKLKPVHGCKERFQCLDTEIYLGPGETVFVISPELWSLEFKAASLDITLAISSAVVWDSY